MSKEIEWHLPPYTVEWQGDTLPAAETIPQFLSKRGDWKKLKEITGNGKGIKVGVGDTGVSQNHLDGDLKGVTARSFVPRESANDVISGHGTHVICHVLARGDDTGIQGLASDATGLAAKVLSNRGSGASSWIANGINWLTDEGCDIINLSLGGGYSQQIEDAVRRADEAGVIVFAALGNDGTRSSGWPGNSKHAIGVAAVDFNLNIARFSSRSNEAELSGYGVSVLSCFSQGYQRLSGTSMATPDQSGVCALILSYMKKIGKPVRGREAYMELVKPAVIDRGATGKDREYGYGFVDVWKVIEQNPAEEKPEEPTEPTPTPECPEIVTEFEIADKKYGVIEL